VPTTLSVLKQAKVAYDYINIHHDPDARAFVRMTNNGNESVPTLAFPDGSTLTEPSTNELRKKLEALGYHVPFTALITGNLWFIVTSCVMLWAVLRFLGFL